MYTQLKILVFALGVIILSQKATYAAECHGQNILSEKTCIGDELDVEE